jgi:hypothetical protein
MKIGENSKKGPFCSNAGISSIKSPILIFLIYFFDSAYSHASFLIIRLTFKHVLFYLLPVNDIAHLSLLFEMF